MVLPTILLPEDLLVKPEPLSPATFEPFGTVIAPPFPSSLSQYPRTSLPASANDNERRQALPIPPPLFPHQQVQAVAANQSTALKTSPVSPLLNNYSSIQNSYAKPGSRGQVSIFSCFPRENIYAVGTGERLKLGILERHPYTTQTFCPFNYSSASSTSAEDTYMVVVVAPTTINSKSDPPNPPDLSKIRCFIARLNDPEDMKMAVTYNAGTWHAPMIVLGSRRVDFLVTQFANGVPHDDCQEVLIGSGPDEACLTSHELHLRSQKAGRLTDTKQAEIDVGFIRTNPEHHSGEKKNTTAEDAANETRHKFKTSKL